MKQPPFKRTFKRSQFRGFALVITVSILVLLAVIAIGLLSLSTITVRTASRGDAQAEARANAKLALMLAIGDLQKSMGPDQRVSANGSILSDSDVTHPHWTGVWDSWKAGDSPSGGPDEASEHRTIPDALSKGMHPTYKAQREDHFRSWLVSLDQNEAGSATSPKDLVLEGSATPENDSSAVRLVGEGSLGADGLEQDYVSARLLNLKTRKAGAAANGRYGWWIGDESQKARVMSDSHESIEDPSLAQKIFRHQAPGSTGTTTVEGLEALTDDTQLEGLTSLLSLDLVDGVLDRPSVNFHQITPFSRQVLADVREGGLKRDLSVLLERPIKESRRNGLPMETTDEFMLYRFDKAGQERVPLQDLVAYYQLYDGNRSGWKKGVRYSSNLVNNGPQITSADYGAKQDDPNTFLREYTSLYRNPVPIKIQFLLSLNAVPRDPNKINRNRPDTHKLQMGISPSVTFWNPTNLPMVLNYGNANRYAHMLRMMNMPLNIRWNKNDGAYKSSTGTHMTWATQQVGGFKANIFSLYMSGTRPVVFEPGEVKVFSLPFRESINFRKTDRFHEPHEIAAGWDAGAFLRMPRSDRNSGSAHVEDNCLTFRERDEISFEVTPDNNELASGIAMSFLMIQNTYQQHGNPGRWHFRQYQHMSRYGRGGNTAAFNTALMRKGFADKRSPLITSAPRSGAQIIARADDNEPWPFLQFALMAGTETHETSNGGAFAGRKFASRPFLHSTAMAPSFIDREDDDSLYNYGWNWWIEEINSVFEANVQISPENQGYYGGGYTPESGTSHVIQQEIPVVPPMSIAAFSHAHLGGFSLASDAATGTGEDPGAGYHGLVNPFGKDSWQQITATGQGGLFPHTLQAIGNSYAHPHIPADKAYTTWDRHYDATVGNKRKTLADHSYLANKALWDEFFFSSISPQPKAVELFGNSSSRSAEELAEEFFFEGEALPNPRMVPYTTQLDESDLTSLFRLAQTYRNGLGDKIAGHLMVEGPFNVNSTSVEAWKVVLSSLKGKKVSYLNNARNGGVQMAEEETTGTPLASFTLPNAKPFAGSTSDPAEENQWVAWRELSDEEIEELAIAMVKQVKLRGPFLSLSEFVNRRLDSSEKELSVKGALQAALDDEDVSINEGFRDGARQFGRAEINTMNPAFPEALAGPVAYGSAAYVDQADVLRNFASQLTPRGDTFVIRTYGDSLDGNGNVQARAWCEAVVQRVPEYLDLKDEAHLKTSDLTSDANKRFGRRLKLVSFRFLSPSEI